MGTQARRLRKTHIVAEAYADVESGGGWRSRCDTGRRHRDPPVADDMTDRTQQLGLEGFVMVGGFGAGEAQEAQRHH